MGQMLSGLTGGGMDTGQQQVMAAGGNVPIAGIGGPSAGDLTAMTSGFQGLNDMANSLGDSPEERSKNVRAFSSLVDQLGKMSKDIAGSTIMQRVMQGRIRPIMAMSPPGAGGVAQLPSTLPPEMAQGIMSRMGYR